MCRIGFFILFGACLALGFAQPLTSVEGVVELRASAEEPWYPARTGDILKVGGELRTFQGDVIVELDGGGLRLGPDSELLHPPRAYKLVSGKAYARADNVVFDMTGPVFVSGEVRVDAHDDTRRVVLLEGEGHLTLGGSVLQLEPMQQLIVGAEEPHVSSFYERDPWYQDLVAIGEGVGRATGFEGEADMQIAEVVSEDAWEVVELDAQFAPVVFARTADASWLEIRFDDGSLLRLQADTEITVQRLEEFEDGTRRSLVQLRRGKVWAVVEGDGQPFEIETPGLVAGVRGTKLRVDAATGDAPPLLKTFEGEVAAVIGFEIFDVTEGEQFDTESGLAPLQLDALDSFNLERDRLAIAPTVTLEPLPSSVTGETLSVRGETDGLLLHVGAQELETVSPRFEVETRLESGFNLVAVRSSYEQGGAAAYAVQPVIRAEPGILLAVAPPERVGGAVRLRGAATAGSRIAVSGSFGERQTTASPRGRFTLTLPAFSGDLSVTATSPLGAHAKRIVNVPE